jgi:hypothetical protein
MLTDLADLTPPLVVCVAIIITVILVLRHQMAPKRREGPAARPAVTSRFSHIRERPISADVSRHVRRLTSHTIFDYGALPAT